MSCLKTANVRVSALLCRSANGGNRAGSNAKGFYWECHLLPDLHLGACGLPAGLRAIQGVQRRRRKVWMVGWRRLMHCCLLITACLVMTRFLPITSPLRASLSEGLWVTTEGGNFWQYSTIAEHAVPLVNKKIVLSTKWSLSWSRANFPAERFKASIDNNASVLILSTSLSCRLKPLTNEWHWMDAAKNLGFSKFGVLNTSMSHLRGDAHVAWKLRWVLQGMKCSVPYKFWRVNLTWTWKHHSLIFCKAFECHRQCYFQEALIWSTHAKSGIFCCCSLNLGLHHPPAAAVICSFAIEHGTVLQAIWRKSGGLLARVFSWYAWLLQLAGSSCPTAVVRQRSFVQARNSFSAVLFLLWYIHVTFSALPLMATSFATYHLASDVNYIGTNQLHCKNRASRVIFSSHKFIAVIITFSAFILNKVVWLQKLAHDHFFHQSPQRIQGQYDPLLSSLVLNKGLNINFKTCLPEASICCKYWFWILSSPVYVD